jgi:hypothetical protein
MREIFAFILCLILISSCAKPDQYLALSNFRSLERYVENNKQSFYFKEGNKRIFLKTDKEAYISFPSKSFNSFGSLFKGDVRIDVTDIYSKADMMIAGLPTVFCDDHGQHLPMASGGEILIEAFDARLNVRLDLNKPSYVSMSAYQSDTYLTDMGLFELLNVETLLWVTSVPLDSAMNQVREREARYEFFSDKMKWYNVDKVLDIFPNSQLLRFIYPNGFNPNNSDAYINIKSLPNSLLNASTKLPLGEACQLFFIARLEDEFLFAHQDFVMSVGKKVDFSSVPFITGSEEELRDYLNGVLE